MPLLEYSAPTQSNNMAQVHVKRDPAQEIERTDRGAITWNYPAAWEPSVLGPGDDL